VGNSGTKKSFESHNGHMQDMTGARMIVILAGRVSGGGGVSFRRERGPVNMIAETALVGKKSQLNNND
jgi:hypothetical protein